MRDIEHSSILAGEESTDESSDAYHGLKLVCDDADGDADTHRRAGTAGRGCSGAAAGSISNWCDRRLHRYPTDRSRVGPKDRSRLPRSRSSVSRSLRRSRSVTKELQDSREKLRQGQTVLSGEATLQLQAGHRQAAARGGAPQ